MAQDGSARRRLTAGEWGLLGALSVLWGGSFFFVGVAVAELPPVTIVALRVALAAAALLLLMRLLGARPPADRRVWAAFFGMGLLNNAVPFTLIVWGQTTIASGVASILNATTPLFTALIAHVLTEDEKLSPGLALGGALGLAGVAVLMGGAALQEVGAQLLAQLAILGAALSYGFAGVFGRRFKAMGVSPLATATGQLCASSLLLLPLALAVDQPWSLPMPSPATIGALLGLALLSTALAYILYFRILATAGATNLLLVTLLIPVSATLLGVAFLGERIAAQHLIGMALIGLGLGAIDGRPLAALRRRGRGTAETPARRDGQ